MTDILLNGHAKYLSDSLEVLLTILSPDKAPIKERRKVRMDLNELAVYLRTLQGDTIDVTC